MVKEEIITDALYRTQFMMLSRALKQNSFLSDNARSLVETLYREVLLYAPYTPDSKNENKTNRRRRIIYKLVQIR